MKSLELQLFWLLAAISFVFSLYTIVFSKDKELRSSVLFNLLSFLVGTAFLFFIRKEYIGHFKPAFGIKNWVPFFGVGFILYLLFADFLFYIYHRLTHTIPLLWLGHISHHNASRMHFSLILRENILIHLVGLPVSLLGAPLGLLPEGVFVCFRLINLYQGFMHFQVEKDWPGIRQILMTPYQHIIHHSKLYDGVGQNFGGIFSFWDRIFRSYRTGDQYLHEFGVPDLPDDNSLWTLNITPLVNLVKRCSEQRSIIPLFLFSKMAMPAWTVLCAYGFIAFLVLDIALKILN